MRHAAGWGDAPLRPEQGLRLGGRYELRRRIAVGGMGEVWLSRDLSLERSVATKVLRQELAGDGRFLDRLRAEARTSAPLAHPNIAALYDYGEQAGSGYLVMELVPGETLSQLLERELVLAPEDLLPILAQAARALHAAHVCGVVHRDVKPSNILLTPEGEVKITDFGISLTTSRRDDSSPGTVMGTAQYLSPEQAMGRPATPASDIYGLGVVAYEALAGRRPFTGASLVEIATAHVHQPVPSLPLGIPAPVRAVVMRMLEKDPERRPRSAASLARTLDRIAAELELARPFDEGRGGGTAAAQATSTSQAAAQAASRAQTEPEPPPATEPFDVPAAWFPVSTSPREAAAPRTPAPDDDAAPDDLDDDAAPEDPDDDVAPQWLPTHADPAPTPGPARTHAARPTRFSPGAHAATRARRRSTHRRRRHVALPPRAWLWVTLVVTVTIAAVLALVAGTLTGTGEGGSAVGAPAVSRTGAAGSAAPLLGDSGVGPGSPHLTQIEVTWW